MRFAEKVVAPVCVVARDDGIYIRRRRDSAIRVDPVMGIHATVKITLRTQVVLPLPSPTRAHPLVSFAHPNKVIIVELEEVSICCRTPEDEIYRTVHQTVW